jgi:FAD-dependent urate hydroxylase
LNALIVGAGIGGLSAAVALRRVGVDPVVVEAAPVASPGLGGAFMNIAPNGINALAALGLAEQVAAAGFHSTGIEFHNRRGRTIGRLDSSQEQRRFGARNVMIRRAALHEILLEQVQRSGIDIVWDSHILNIDEHDHTVNVAFEDGRVMSAPFVIGADGVRSRTRDHVTGDTQPNYLGLVDIAGFAPNAPKDAAPGPQRMIFGRRAFFSYYVTPTGETWWFSNIPHDQPPTRHGLAALITPGWQQRLLTLHRDDPPQISAIITASERPVGAWPVTDLESLPRWHTNRVCLIGDAAHATSPSAGQGASLAIEDAVWLADLVDGHTLGRNAFEHFEQQRRPRVERLIADARRNSSTKTPEPVARAARDLLLPVFLRLGAAAASRAYDHQLPALPAPPDRDPSTP